MALPLRIAGYQGEESVHTRAMRVLLRALDEAGVFAPAFEPDIATRGRKVADLLGLVEGGELDLCYFSSSYLAARVPALGALDIPFKFADRADTRARLDAGLAALLAREVASRTGYVVLSFWDNGLRQLSNGKRAVLRPSDCAGLRIRTLPSETYHATFRALGMTPVTIDVGDMVRAIAAGEVDAQENPLTNIRLFKLQKHHRHVTMTGHFHGIALLLCNARAFAGWPEEARKALMAAAGEATVLQWRLAADEDETGRAALAAEGVEIADLGGAERAAFREAVRGVAEQALAQLPPEAAALLR